MTLIFKLKRLKSFEILGTKSTQLINFKDQQYILAYINQALIKLMRDIDWTTKQDMLERKEMVSQVRVMIGNYTRKAFIYSTHFL